MAASSQTAAEGDADFIIYLHVKIDRHPTG